MWKPPFHLDVTDAIREGENQLEIKVTNLWPNRLIGDAHLPEARRTTWTNNNQWKKNSEPLPSGLLGPVEIMQASP